MTQYNTQDYFKSFSQYIGIPYSEPAKMPNATRKTGLHCWELAEKIMVEAFKINPPPINYIGSLAQVEPVFLSNLENWQSVENGEQQGGDLVLIRMRGYPAHCGVMISKLKFIHVMPGVGKYSTCEDIKNIQWRNRILGFHRWNKND